MNWDTSVSGPSGKVLQYATHSYDTESPAYSHQQAASVSGPIRDGSSPSAALSSSKTFACPFCLEVGISDGASRISDLRRHFRTKHYTNAQWHCNTEGCQMVFDWQSAYESHMKRAHPDADKTIVLSSSEAMEVCRTQVVFACGFNTCRKVFEVASGDAGGDRGSGGGGDPAATAKDYFHHVANHFQDGTSTEEWHYSRRIRNLLHQSGIRDAWKALKPRYGAAPPLQWQPHNSTVLRKKLECGEAEDPKAIVQLAVMLGSQPYNSPDSPLLDSARMTAEDYGTPRLLESAVSRQQQWQRQQTSGSLKSEHSSSHKPLGGSLPSQRTPTVPSIPGTAHVHSHHRHHPEIGHQHMPGMGGSGAAAMAAADTVGTTTHPLSYRQAQNPAASSTPYDWAAAHPLYQFPGLSTAGMGEFSSANTGDVMMEHEPAEGYHHHQSQRSSR